MTDKKFIVLRNLLDSLYRRLNSQGVGYNAKPTEALTKEDEEKLWAVVFSIRTCLRASSIVCLF